MVLLELYYLKVRGAKLGLLSCADGITSVAEIRGLSDNL